MIKTINFTLKNAQVNYIKQNSSSFNLMVRNIVYNSLDSIQFYGLIFLRNFAIYLYKLLFEITNRSIGRRVARSCYKRDWMQTAINWWGAITLKMLCRKYSDKFSKWNVLTKYTIDENVLNKYIIDDFSYSVVHDVQRGFVVFSIKPARN